MFEKVKLTTFVLDKDRDILYATNKRDKENLSQNHVKTQR